jgi:uroporphyrinogen III methyltransferase/synthase
MRNLSEIMKQLLAYGRSANTPVAVIKDGTMPDQKTIVGSLSNITLKVKENRLSSPVVIVVGEVVNLREKFRWFDNRPLFGKRILVTRARHQASALSRLLSERGAKPIELPAIDIKANTNAEELTQAISDLEHYQWIVFTSVNGVEIFFRRLHSLNLDTRALKNLKIGVIGPATAKALEKEGIIPDYLPDVYTSEGLIDGLSNRDIDGDRVLLPRADIADKELVEGIARLGAEVHEVAAYKTVPVTGGISQAKRMLSAGEIDVITFSSSSTVSNLVAALEDERQVINSVRIACIGPKTADMAASAGLGVDIVASEYTIPGLVTAIEEHFLSKET